MGFIKAFAGAIGGTFADQWKDFITPMAGVPATAAIFPAVAHGQNAGRGENTKGSNGIISNGSRILVPDGTALITLQEGAVTGLITEPGGYTFSSEDVNTQSIFAGDGIVSSLIKQSWERFKFGGQPGSQQMAIYVNLKEIVGNRFGTPNPIRWKDPFTETKMGAAVRGTYNIKIDDPILFIKNFIPISYVNGGKVFDFSDQDNPIADQLFSEVVSCLSPTFVNFAKENEGAIEIEDFQANQNLLGRCLSQAVEEEYQWKSQRGIEVTRVTIVGLDYDEESKEFYDQARKSDVTIRERKKMGNAYSENLSGMMAAATGEAMQNAANNPNGGMMGFMGMNMAGQTGANVMGAATNMQQQTEASNTKTDPAEELAKYKKMLDEGLITQDDYDAKKKQILGV